MSEKIEVTKRRSAVDRSTVVYETRQVAWYGGSGSTSAREKAEHYAAIADYIDAEQKAEEAAKKAREAKEAKKKLNARRNALARELTGHESYYYGNISYAAQVAIDRVIELEDRLKAKEAGD